MASFSRSGETVVLRALNAHPRIHVVHQIQRPDERTAIKLAKTLGTFAETSISHTHPAVLAAKVPQGASILLKNATWSHSFPFKGFVLVRNPFAIANSAKITVPRSNRKDKYKRWADSIDPKVSAAINSVDDLVTLCMLWNRKMAPLSQARLPIVRYEDFVTQPEKTLRSLLSRLNLDWSDSVLNSHAAYPEAMKGHGGIHLSQPVHSRSLDSWKQLPRAALATIYGITYSIMVEFGYTYDGEDIHLNKSNPNIV